MAIDKLKKRKAAGPDLTFAELYKYLGRQGRTVILKILRYSWKNDVAPQCMNKANVVTLYKKGNLSKPENYRPVALLNMLYKIYTIIIRERLKIVDNHIRETQYGFRKKHKYTATIIRYKKTNGLYRIITRKLCYRITRLGKNPSTKSINNV